MNSNFRVRASDFQHEIYTKMMGFTFLKHIPSSQLLQGNGGNPKGFIEVHLILFATKEEKGMKRKFGTYSGPRCLTIANGRLL